MLSAPCKTSPVQSVYMDEKVDFFDEKKTKLQAEEIRS
jgi:hypothetical protein